MSQPKKTCLLTCTRVLSVFVVAAVSKQPQKSEMSKQTKFSNFVKGRSPSSKKNEKLNVFVDHLQNVRRF